MIFHAVTEFTVADMTKFIFNLPESVYAGSDNGKEKKDKKVSDQNCHTYTLKLLMISTFLKEKSQRAVNSLA